jgi:UDP-3-O-[3-hydroxymyristoyl] glucosamine N-acyltransferase
MLTPESLAERLHLELRNPVAGTEIQRLSSIAAAGPASLVFASDAASTAAAAESDATAILLPRALAEAVTTAKTLLLSANPRLDFARAARLLREQERPTGTHPTAIIDASAIIAASASIAAGAVIAAKASIGERSIVGEGAVVGHGVTVGADCRIYPCAVLYPGTTLGDRVVVHAGAVLGADGFGYVHDPATGEYLPFPQQGVLVVEDDVEIGANTTIDRGALDETRIGRGTKIDNLVHLGHNVRVGCNTVIAAQTGISGSTTVGDSVMLGGQVGIGDHAHIGDGVILGGQGGILPGKKLDGRGVVFWGTPAKPVREFLRELATLTRLSKRRKWEDQG